MPSSSQQCSARHIVSQTGFKQTPSCETPPSRDSLAPGHSLHPTPASSPDAFAPESYQENMYQENICHKVKHYWFFCHLMILMAKLRLNLYIFEVTYVVEHHQFSLLWLTLASERKALKLCSVCWICSLQSSTDSASRSRVSPSVSNQSLIYRERRLTQCIWM